MSISCPLKEKKNKNLVKKNYEKHTLEGKHNFSILMTLCLSIFYECYMID